MKEKIIEILKENETLTECKEYFLIKRKDYQKVANELLEAINYTRCCKSDSELLPNMTLKQAIEKAKPNLDKIKDVDKHIEDIR